MKLFKVVSVLIVLLSFLVFNMQTQIYAKTPDDIISGGKEFIDIGSQNADKNISKEKSDELIGVLYNVLFVTAIVAALIVGIVLGIKFVIGSVEEQAEIKKALVPYIVGCVIVFGAFTIWKITVNVLQGTESSYQSTPQGGSQSGSQKGVNGESTTYEGESGIKHSGGGRSF